MMFPVLIYYGCKEWKDDILQYKNKLWKSVLKQRQLQPRMSKLKG